MRPVYLFWTKYKLWLSFCPWTSNECLHLWSLRLGERPRQAQEGKANGGTRIISDLDTCFLAHVGTSVPEFWPMISIIYFDLNWLQMLYYH